MAEYKVTYKDRKGVRHSYTRDTVERAYLLYKMRLEDSSNVELFEVSGDMEIRLRPLCNSYEASLIEKEREEPKKEEPKKSFFEMMFGCTVEEYNEALRDFASWHGLPPGTWEIEA